MFRMFGVFFIIIFNFWSCIESVKPYIQSRNDLLSVWRMKHLKMLLLLNTVKLWYNEHQYNRIFSTLKMLHVPCQNTVSCCGEIYYYNNIVIAEFHHKALKTHPHPEKTCSD
jgi:hypothetical protein